MTSAINWDKKGLINTIQGNEVFKLSKAAEYAIRGILYLSLKSDGETSDVEEVARAQDIPPAYLAKLFQSLARKGFIRSSRGPYGGFMLVKKPGEISVLEIIEAVEGPIFLNDCLIHKGVCPRDEICPVHEIWGEAQGRFLGFLRKATFEKLVQSARQKANKEAFF